MKALGLLGFCWRGGEWEGIGEMVVKLHLIFIPDGRGPWRTRSLGN